MRQHNAILLGGGGHGRVVRALAEVLGLKVIGICDPGLEAAEWFGLPVLGDDSAVERHRPDATLLLNGIGKLPGSDTRRRLQDRLSLRGYGFPVLVHPFGWVAPDAELAAGVQIMAGAVVQPGCRIGAGSILNSRVSVDHGCVLGADVHLAPGAVLCGDVTVADGAFVGAGAVILQGRRIGAGSVVAAGAIITRDLEPGETAFGRGGRSSLREGGMA